MIILPANTLATGAYEVANSCRSNDGDSAYMHKTPGSNGNARTFTISAWIKRGTTGLTMPIFSSGVSGTDAFDLFFQGTDTLSIEMYESGVAAYNVKTSALFKDSSAFYHILVVVDTTQGTEANRYKFYINGSQVDLTEVSTGYPAQDYDIPISQTNTPVRIGRGTQYSSNYFDGYMAEVVFIDGTAYAPTDFGEFDEDSPTIWKPKDVSGLTFGTNGFYLDFEDSSNLGNDANGGTDLTEVNLAATDQSTDTPTNNFCVMNPLATASYTTLTEGNLLSTGSSSDESGSYGTMAANNGKWYAEFKATVGSSSAYPWICVSHVDGSEYGRLENGGGGTPGNGSTASGCYRADGGKRSNSSTSSSWGDTFDDDDIIGLAIDCDNGAAYAAKNGTWQNSGDPTSGASKTGALVTWTPANEDAAVFADTQYNASSSNWNFGSPAYANSSDAADANGYGKFEYAPPTGYYALCTKNLAEFG